MIFIILFIYDFMHLNKESKPNQLYIFGLYVKYWLEDPFDMLRKLHGWHIRKSNYRQK